MHHPSSTPPSFDVEKFVATDADDTLRDVDLSLVQDALDEIDVTLED
jgi:hypothetical protein